MASPVVNLVEQGIGTSFKEGVQNWFTHSGEAYLKSLGKHGEFLAGLLRSHEQFRDSNTSTATDTIKKILSKVPESDHQHVEDLVQGKTFTPNTPEAAQAAQELSKFKSQVINKSQQAGITTQLPSRTGRTVKVPLVMHPDGPLVSHPDLAKPNSKLRQQAINEVLMRTGAATPHDASVILDNIINGQNGKRAVSNISNPLLQIQTGKLPVQERWQRWAESAAQGISHNVYFGPQDQQLAKVIEHTLKINGKVSANNVADFLDVYFKEASSTRAYRDIEGIRNRAGYSPTTDAERVVKKLSSYILTSKIAIPHATQLVNTMQNSGIINTLKAVNERLTNWPAIRDFVVHSGAFQEQLAREWREAVQGKPSLFQRMFHQPGFDWIRARQVEVSALAGRFQAKEAAEKLLGGDARAENTLKRLGIDVAKFRQAGGLTPEMESQAAYNAAQQAMFSRSPLNTPFMKEASPFARMINLYSQYHFNMFRMLYQGSQAAYKEGGLAGVTKFLGKLAIIFPIAGEFVTLAENGLYRRNLDKTDIEPIGVKPIDMYLNALVHASAFGVIYSIGRANSRQLVENYTVGPLFSTLINTMTDGVDALRGKDKKPIERDIMKRIPVVGSTVSGTVLPYEDKPKGVGIHTRLHR